MISVCMAVYNGERYIERQLRSILCQLGEKDEIVLSDDGSTDATLRIIQSFSDKRVRVIDGPHRKSPVWNFEKALLNAKGDYIFLSDQDDEWMPNKVKVSIHYLKEYDCVVSDNIVVDGHEQIICNSFYELNHMHSGKFYNLLIRNNYLGCCMAFRRNVLEASLPFPRCIPMHDIWIGNVAAFKFDLIYIPEKLILFNRHGENASSTASVSRNSFYKKIFIRYRIIIELLKLYVNR